MVSITIGIDEQTRQLMKKFPEMNWSGFVRKAIKDKTNELSEKEQILAKLKKESLNEEIDFGRKINTSVTLRLKKENLL
ncbi:MAG: hypothetical protein ACMXYC_00160 [Candidatus Woesearchaeota archaeon]